MENDIEKKKSVSGRKPLPEKELRKELKIYLNEGEKQILIDQWKAVHKMKFGTFCRQKLLGDSNSFRYINTIELLPVMDRHGTELSRIGNNINQLAKIANEHRIRNVLDPKTTERMNIVMAEYNELLTKIQKHFDIFLSI